MNRRPALISDGGGLPFPPDSLERRSDALDPSDPPVVALLEQIEFARRQAQPQRLLRPKQAPPPLDDNTKLQGWRELARTEDEVLYGRGRPPRLITVPVKRGLRNRWKPLGASSGRPLRASRDGIRASSWRVDPTQLPGSDATELRLLLTELTKATGRMADDRLLAPDLYLGDDELILRLYVKPIEGYVGGTRRHETPVIVRLPEPVGARRLVDGAVYETG